MPYSSGLFDLDVERFIRAAQPRAVLDVGAGSGKYGVLVRRVSPQTHLTAIEIDLEYVERFKLREIYDDVLVSDVETLMRDVDGEFDIVILGDVIEHLRKSVGIDLLNFLIYRARRILVIFPLRYRQGAFEGRAHEAHISVWSPSDFQWCSATSEERDDIAFVQIDGFID
jgi:SAM-dependent methyltransferase